MRNAELNELQVGIKTDWRNTNSLRYGDDTILVAESKEELQSLLMRLMESERVSLKLMASGPITSRQIKGEKVEVETDFLFLGI